MTTEDLAPPIDPQEHRIKQLEGDVQEAQEKYLRLLADTENTRKRMQKEKLEANKFAIEALLSEIFVPMDNLENALKHTSNLSDETRQWAMGFGMILNQFKDVLVQNGVVSFVSEGQKFDPHKHEAVELEETEAVPEGTILKEFVKGYRCGERTIRPARVKVAKAPTLNQPNQEESHDKKEE
jgi:molecular chaperone GrpE